MTASIKNDRRTVFGWAMYDWANSAYSTVIAGAVLPVYFESTVVGDAGWRGYSGEALWSFVTGGAAFLMFLAMPILGAVADFSARKRRFLSVFAYGGSLFTLLLFFAKSGNVLLTLILFFLAQVGFVAGNVFYDGFLPDISTPDTIDKVSAKGYAIGYVGGGVYLALSLAFIQLAEPLGVDAALAARIAIAGVGVWWAGFTAFALSRLGETGTARAVPDRLRSLPPWRAYSMVGFGRTIATTRRLTRFPQLLLFVVAFMLFNDGVQTTINISAVYASGTLGLGTTTIAGTFLIVQFVAFGGALLFARLADHMGTKRAIQVSLVVWIGVAVAAYYLPAGRPLPFLAVGVVIGIVLGGTQALSRSLYGSMIPEAASAEFYGFYSVFSKFSAIWGPLAFGIVRQATGSGRAAILSLIAFFVVGAVLLALVDVDRARASRLEWDFDGPADRDR
jgi:UMF1 family MFS transporter